jgi:IS30 family transposase
MIAAKLNGRPRETLDWKSPARKLAQVLEESSAAGVAPTA